MYKITKKRLWTILHIDDSCAATLPTTMFRADLLIYKKNKNVTAQFILDYNKNDPAIADFDTIKNIMNLIEKKP